LTYLSKDDQKIVYKALNDTQAKLTIGKAKALVNAAKKEPLTRENVRNILLRHQARKSSYRLNIDVYDQYFSNTKPEAVDGIISQTLELWKASQKW
jgi:hypothetical protein